MITYKLEGEGDFRSYGIYANDVKLKVFTYKTGLAAVKRFCTLAEPYCDELERLELLCTERIQWNIDNPDAPLKQKMHPCFNEMERLWNKIQREAKIKNT